MSAVLGGTVNSFSTNSTPYEWTFIYQAPSSVTPSDPNITTVSGNDWRFFFNANGANPTANGFKGFFVTQNGNNLEFYYLCKNCNSKTKIGNSYSVTPGQKYIIRGVWQSNNGGSYVFYVGDYTGPGSSATTLINTGIRDDQNVASNTSSFFQASVNSGNDGIFKWDDLNFYQATLTLSPLNNTGTGTGGNGIATFLNQNDTQKAVFGFKATAMGSVTMTNCLFSWTTSGSRGNAFYFTNAKLYYSSDDDVYTPAADDNSIGAVTLSSSTASISQLSQTITNTSRNYFLVVDVNDYALATTTTATIGLTNVKISGNSPTTITSGISGLNFTLPATPVTWTGATSNAWTLPANWKGGSTPLTTSSVIIPSGLTNYPKLTADASVNTLSINNGTIDLNGYNLNVSNSLSANNGTITTTGNSSYLNITGGSGDRSVSGTGLTVTNLKVNLPSSSNTLNIYSPLTINNLLTPTKGIISSGGKITLASNDSSSASVDVITTTNASITGDVNVQRYITGGAAKYRGYRLVSSPTNISSKTDGTGYIDIGALNNNSSGATGVVTGIGAYTGGPAASGFTANGLATPTIYLYDERFTPSGTGFNAGKHKGITAINDGGTSTSSVDIADSVTTATTMSSVKIPVGNGYLYYNIGPASQDSTAMAATAIPPSYVIVNKGYLNQGDVPVKLWYTPTGGDGKLSYTTNGTTVYGYNMVGNPYAATIDLNHVISNNSDTNNGIADYIYEFNDDNSSGQSYIVYKSDGTSSDPAASRYIVSGQGFMVRALSTSSTLTFTEADKDLTNKPDNYLLSAAPLPRGKVAGFYLKMERDSIVHDYCGVYFGRDWDDSYTAHEDAIDIDAAAAKVYMSSYTSDGRRTAINDMADYTNTSKSIKLYVNAITDGTYTLKIEQIRNIDPLYDIWLKDNFKKDSVDFRANPAYTFNITRSNAATFGAARFVLIIRRKALPAYQLLSVKAAVAGGGVNVVWKTQNEYNFTGFTVEKYDAATKLYNPLGFTQSDGSGTYNYTDKNPVAGINTYRIKQDDMNGKITYSTDASAIALKDNIPDKGALTIYPNPAATTTLNLQLNNNVKGTLNVLISNGNGVVMCRQTFNQQQGTIDVSKLRTGIYFVRVSSVETGQEIGAKEFIKL